MDRSKQSSNSHDATNNSPHSHQSTRSLGLMSATGAGSRADLAGDLASDGACKGGRLALERGLKGGSDGAWERRGLALEGGFETFSYPRFPLLALDKGGRLTCEQDDEEGSGGNGRSKLTFGSDG